MTINTEIQLLSLTFMWVFSAMFCMAIYLTFRRAGYAYLRLGVATLIAELIRQIANDLTISYPSPLVYLVSSVAFFSEALLCLATVSCAGQRPLRRKAVSAAIAGYVAVLLVVRVIDSQTRWAWYLDYSPMLVLQALVVRESWRLYRSRWVAAGWLLASSIAVLATHMALPWLTVNADIVFGFVYFADGLIFSLMMGTIMLMAVEQLANEKTLNLAQREQAESTTRFLLDNTEDIIISHAEDGTLLSWNNRAQEVFGYDARDVVGKLHVDKLIAPWTGTEVKRREAQAFTSDGRRLPVEVAQRHGILDNRIYHTLVIRDLSAMREIEARQELLSDQLREVQKLESLGVLAAGIAHDFNNLLASMMGHAELAGKQLTTPMQARQSITQILTAAHRASELTEQMLTYAGKADFNPVLVDLNATIEEIVALMSTSISPEATFDLELSANARISADRAQLTQVLINLISNASDALAEGAGCIRICTAMRHLTSGGIQRLALGNDLESGDYVTLQVSDDGTGMSDAVRRRVFEPFFSTKFTGRGLGLAAVAGIVKKHSSAVSVESAPGQGTTFTVYFPVPHDTTETMDLGRHDYVPRTRGLCALVVDDNVELLNLYESILSSAQHKTVRARTGEEAVAIATRDPRPDLLIMDYSLPGMSGLDVYKSLAAANVRLPVVFVTGVNVVPLVAQLDQDWPASILKKPFMTDELLEAMDNVSGGEKQGIAKARR